MLHNKEGLIVTLTGPSMQTNLGYYGIGAIHLGHNLFLYRVQKPYKYYIKTSMSESAVREAVCSRMHVCLHEYVRV